MDSATLKFLVILAVAAVALYLTTRSQASAKAMEKYTVADIREGVDDDEDTEPVVQQAINKALSSQTAATLGVASSMMPKAPVDTGFFGQFAPDPKELTGQNFVDATRWTSLGAMTSRRNINRDIRADVPIPKNMSVSPWNQSTIDQQQAGVPLC